MKNKVGYKFETWASKRKDIKMKKSNIISEVLSDYYSHTTLHGIGYLGAKNKTLPEKIFWIIIFAASLSTCLYLIMDTWFKWKQNPVLLSFEKEQTPIWSIPFPAVTICPLNKVQQTKYNYTKMFRRRQNLTDDEYKKFWDISLICDLEQFGEEFHSTINYSDTDAIHNIFSVAPLLNTTLFLAQWQDEADLSLFEEHINKEGLCYSFNTLTKDDMFTKEMYKDINGKYTDHHSKRNIKWTMEDGYAPNSDMRDYPRRTAQDGAGSGLSFILYSFVTNIDYVCGLAIDGYKIILHNPVETAKTAQQYFLLNDDKKATIMVTPQLTTTSTSLKSLTAHARNCYFSHEKTLRFFKVYTQNNCKMECETNITEQYCGCVPFYTSRDANSLICGFGKMKCLKEIESKIMNYRMMEKGINVIDEEMKTITYKIFSACDCLPPCNDLQFHAEITHTKIHYLRSTTASGISSSIITPQIREEMRKGLLSINHVDIFFKDSHFLALRRSELYGQTSFLASCGGLLGLFMGFSILSLVELIYFLTLRVWCKIRNRD